MYKQKLFTHTLTFTLILTLFSLFVLLTEHVKSQWIQTNGPGGGTVISLVISGNNIFAGRASSGVALSTNNGSDWKQTGLINQDVFALVISGSNLYAGTYGGGVFLSANNGSDWTPVNNGLTNQDVFSLAVIGDYLFAGTFTGVFLSTNNGSSWTHSGLTDPCVYALAVSGNNLFAGTFWGVYISTNNGANWTQVNDGLTNQDVHSLAVSSNNLFAGTYGGGVFLSANNGSNWIQVNNGLTDQNVTTFAVNGNSLYAGTVSGVFLSTNNGAVWSVTGLNDQYIRSISISGDNMFAGTVSYGVFHSTNNGANWIQTGLTDESVHVFGSGSNVLYAGTFDGVCSTTNGGADWTLTGLRNRDVWSLAFNGSNIFAGSLNGGVFRTTDNGINWTLCLYNDVWAIAVIGNTLFAGTWGGGVYRSTNSGENWSQVNNGIGSQNVKAFAVSSEALFAGTFSNGVFLSKDNGENWSSVSNGLTNQNVISLAFSGNNLFAGTYGGGVFLSTNKGSNWTPVNNGLTNQVVHAFAVIETSILAGTDGGVFLSTNNGAIWQELNDGFGTVSGIYSLGISGNYIFCGTQDRGAWRRNLSDITVSSFCGPGPHFVDNCSAGTDSLDILHNCETNALIRISPDTSDNCNVLTMPLPLFKGPTIIRRSDPKDTSERFPGAAQADGHNDIIETEFVSMDLRSFVVSTTGDTAFLRITAGAGNAEGACGDSLRPTFGYIHELPAYNFSAESFFDVFFELCIEDPYGIIGPPNPRYYLYNNKPVRMSAMIDQIPPKCGIDPITNENYTIYRSDPNACSKLYASCIPGLSGPPIAKVVHVDHALPVELASFTSSVTGNNVTLSWTTLSEINNAGFAIERNSGSKWENAGFVTGQGTVNTISQYEFIERNLSSGRYQYRLKQTDFNGNYEYFSLTESVTIGVPQQFYLGQNYPNPFNPITTISFDIPEAGNVKLKVFDVSGREVKTIVNEFKNAGYFAVKFDAAGLASGAYFYRIEIAEFVSVKKMIILK